MTAPPPNGRHSPPPTTKTVDQPLRDVGLYVIRHAAHGSDLVQGDASRVGGTVVPDPFHVEYRVYASAFEPSLAELQVQRQTTSPRSMGFVTPILVLLAGLWVYWSAHDLTGVVNSVSLPLQTRLVW